METVQSSVDAALNPVQEARCGFVVPPRDPRALAEAIVEIYRMPKEELEAMGHRGREYVGEHHNIAKLARQLERVLENLVS